MKKAANREKDREDLKILLKLKKIENIDKLSEAISKMKGANSNMQFSSRSSLNLKIIFHSKMLHISFFLPIMNQ